MESLETVVLIGVLLIGGSLVAPRLRVPTPLVFLVLGLLVGFIPAVREIHLPSEAVLVLFLPALLFWESLTTSLREIRRDLRGILLLSTLLVVATAFGVAGLGVVFGMSWGAALILGAALAPTDATAVAAMARSLPHRNMTVLRAESLINDGTALVLFSIAVGVAVGNVDYTGWSTTWLVVVAYVGGGLIGFTAAWAASFLLRRLQAPLVLSTTLLVIPFLAFLVAELIHASGVIAVVVAGLFMTQTGPRASTAESRQQTIGFWTVATFILNGALFVLIGIEAQSAVRAVDSGQVWPLVMLAVAAWIGLMLIRFAFQMMSVWLIRLLDRRPSQRARRMPHRARVVSAVAGFRGAVSLAVALAVPLTFATGEVFPGRDQIIFVAAGVVLLTLVVQGVLLPPVLRWAQFAPDHSIDDELVAAHRASTAAAVDAVDELGDALGITGPVRARVLAEYRDRLAVVNADAGDAGDRSLIEQDREEVALRLAVLERKRDVMIALRDRHAISDTTLITMQARLDREELRLTQPDVLE
ncbi:Na+/H+ antiporter [Agromyces sp. ISL-38]|uniref:Na+/H+ antiporter n=1 Tax=Agromyces sp. ISL-38 TaxID=2819107 RepID=UPI001BEC703E|nr:Na+/H+ antiporter [Agromyces sp. ISL-38]MBT2498566.1 Na+/H+ antiporter [Agromyces sp. ISL-38]